ncbi:MAG: hypothetical protein ACREVK_11740 [Gammaproteobacteria bacterium]
MSTTSPGTASAANLFVALAVLPIPTVSQIPTVLEQQTHPILKTTSRSPILATDARVTTIIANHDKYEESARSTTFHEKLIGEIRRWSLLSADWDGEGAATPSTPSMKEAVSFIRLLGDDITLPEPMLLGSGHAALYWNEGSLYADLYSLWVAGENTMRQIGTSRGVLQRNWWGCNKLTLAS